MFGYMKLTRKLLGVFFTNNKNITTKKKSSLEYFQKWCLLEGDETTIYIDLSTRATYEQIGQRRDTPPPLFKSGYLKKPLRSELITPILLINSLILFYL